MIPVGSANATGPRSEDTPRERILASAGRLFSTNGVRATGVNAIIADARVAKATFYRHFPSKNRLVATWLATRATRLLDEVANEAERRATSPADRLRAFLVVATEHMTRPDFGGFPFLDTAVELRDTSPEVSAVIATYVGEIRRFAEGLAADAGAEDSEACGAQLGLLVLGMLAARRLLPGDLPRLQEFALGAAAAIVAAPAR